MRQYIYFKVTMLFVTKTKLVHLVVHHRMNVYQHATKIRIVQKISALFLSHIVHAAKAM